MARRLLPISFVRRLALALLAVAVAACKGPLDRKRVRGAVEQLRGTAAEAAMMSRLDLPGGYAQVQRDQLVDQIDEARDELEQGVTDAALAGPAREAIAIARELAPRVRAGDDTSELARRLARLEPPP